MISRTELNERVREWGLREDIVEKDYVIGWLLWGIGSNPRLSASWAFKGGTCLKKCYLETYRFSEDLDFTVLPGGPIKPDEVTPLLQEIFGRIYEQGGIDFRVRSAVLHLRPDSESAEGRVYYRGPRNAPGVASIKLDLTEAEQVICPTVLRKISHLLRSSGQWVNVLGLEIFMILLTCFVEKNSAHTPNWFVLCTSRNVNQRE
jgi:hypothetical protein